MKIAVIGLGSMGKRRIRLIKNILGENVEIYGVDSNEKRCIEVKNEYGVVCVSDLSILLDEKLIDAAFIATSPLAHASLITTCLEHGIHVFTELNLVDTDYEKNIALAKRNNKVLFLSSTMLYRKEIQYIARCIKEADCSVNYTYHVGQYLPDWHPWDVLEEFFISKKATNGCRELFAIELPWIVNVFGRIVKYDVVKSKASKLPIDYADNYLLLIEHETGHKGVLAVDVISREAVRELSVFGEDIFLKWNGTTHGLVCKNLKSGNMDTINLYVDMQAEHIEGYSSNIIENAYADEIRNFFATINESDLPRYSFTQDKEILKLIDEIEAD